MFHCIGSQHGAENNLRNIQFIAAIDGTIYANKQRKRRHVRKPCDIVIEVIGNGGNKKKLKGNLCVKPPIHQLLDIRP